MLLALQSTSQALDEIGSTRGSILYRAASAWSALTPGTSGQVLTSGGAGADPSWQSPAVAWTGISAGSGASTTANGDSAIVYQVAQTTADRISWRFTESAAGTSSGTPVLLQVDTTASSTAIPLLVKSRANEVFRVSPSTTQIRAAAGNSTNPVYSFTGQPNNGMFLNGTDTAIATGAVEIVRFSAFQLLHGQTGSAGTPPYSFSADANTGMFRAGADILGFSAGGAEILRLQNASAGGGWAIMDEADSNPGTSELDSLDSFAQYMKGDKFVIAYNNGGTMTFISIPLDGSTTTWTHSTTPP